LPCSNKSATPAQLIKIGGKVDFGTTDFPRTEDGLKQGIIKYGPISGGIYDWSHAMTLVGWQVVKEGDRFYTRDLNKSTYWITVPAGSSLIGTTVWIFKNSWGGTWGDAGYVYIQTSMANVGWTHALKTPVQSLVQNYSVQCVDNDEDGYYWWGLGTKPASCPTCPDQPDGNDSNANLGPLDQYGNCVVLGNPPVADFVADKLAINQNQSVSFTDLSTNAPSSWSWQFPGGTPSTSIQQNPVVTYGTPGVYNVTLTVTNSGGSDTESKTNYITVTEYIPAYCSSKGYAVEEWIASVKVNSSTKTSGSSGSAGYQDFLSQVFTLGSGQAHAVTLTPGFSGRSKFEYWSIWIDLNGDKDFDDPGELLLTASKKNSVFSGSITIPVMSALETRMRVSMKRGALAGPCESFSAGEVEDYTVLISGPVAPVANFTASPNPVQAGGMVQFTDLSTGSPTSWNWSFVGGSLNSSTLQNPAVSYPSPGTYQATLLVSNAQGSSSKSINIDVEEATPVDYCEPVNVNSEGGCINTISIGTFSASGSCNGYSLTQSGPALAPGKSYSVTLTPSNSTARYFWRIWIDFNGDGDFIDSGEQLVTINNKKGVATATMVIPAQASGTTRMRITARLNASASPCDDSFVGEVADFVITFGAGSPGKKILEIPEDSNNAASNLTVYPNPTRDLLNIRIDNWSTPSRLVIYNLNGQTILNRTLDSSTATVDAGSWPKGMYLILVYTQDKLLKERVVVE
ncbi:MAG: GEVED domain-containing protein, partial [Bacteroidales bacterium]